MAHKTLENGNVVVDWETGDPEGDRKFMFKAYIGFLNELKSICEDRNQDAALEVFKKWGVSTDNQVDDFPRIWIKIPD